MQVDAHRRSHQLVIPPCYLVIAPSRWPRTGGPSSWRTSCSSPSRARPSSRSSGGPRTWRLTPTQPFPNPNPNPNPNPLTLTLTPTPTQSNPNPNPNPDSNPNQAGRHGGGGARLRARPPAPARARRGQLRGGRVPLPLSTQRPGGEVNIFVSDPTRTRHHSYGLYRYSTVYTSRAPARERFALCTVNEGTMKE